MSEGFTADWLALRAPADSAARSADLARRFLAALPPGAPILDLGAGTGANARYLAALDSTPRAWRLADADAGLLDHASGLPGELERHVADLAAGPLEPLLDGVAGVTASAFLDIVSMDWLGRFAAALAARRLPVLMALSVDGRVVLDPADPDDTRILARFAADQHRDKGFGPAAGPLAPARFAAALADAGYTVVTRRSDWRIEGKDAAFATAYLRGLALADDGDRGAADWLRRRLDAVAAAELQIVVGHVDLFAWP